MNNLNNTKKSKQDLIDKFNNTNNTHIHDSDVKYVIIRFDTLSWCKFKPLECIFGEEDTFDEFNKELIKILKRYYPEESKNITDIHYSTNPLLEKVPSGKYIGKVFDSIKDNDIIFLTWIKKTEWEGSYVPKSIMNNLENITIKT